MRTKGFTLVEVMVVLAIIIVIGTTVTLNLFGNRSQADLTSTTKQIATLLRQAQSDSLAEEQGAAWGVHFDNTSSTQPTYSLFYQISNTMVTVGSYALPPDICYATSSVAVGSFQNILFAAASGIPSPPSSSSITLELMSGGGCPVLSTTSIPTLVRSQSGKIFFDDFNRSSL